MARKTDYDVWYEKFKPIERSIEQTNLWETYGEDLDIIRKINEKYLWTIVTSDNGKMYLIPGYHIVNRFNYIICEKPWKEKQRDYLY